MLTSPNTRTHLCNVSYANIRCYTSEASFKVTCVDTDVQVASGRPKFNFLPIVYRECVTATSGCRRMHLYKVSCCVRFSFVAKSHPKSFSNSTVHEGLTKEFAPSTKKAPGVVTAPSRAVLSNNNNTAIGVSAGVLSFHWGLLTHVTHCCCDGLREQR